MRGGGKEEGREGRRGVGTRRKKRNGEGKEKHLPCIVYSSDTHSLLVAPGFSNLPKKHFT